MENLHYFYDLSGYGNLNPCETLLTQNMIPKNHPWPLPRTRNEALSLHQGHRSQHPIPQNHRFIIPGPILTIHNNHLTGLPHIYINKCQTYFKHKNTHPSLIQYTSPQHNDLKTIIDILHPHEMYDTHPIPCTLPRVSTPIIQTS